LLGDVHAGAEHGRRPLMIVKDGMAAALQEPRLAVGPDETVLVMKRSGLGEAARYVAHYRIAVGRMHQPHENLVVDGTARRQSINAVYLLVPYQSPGGHFPVPASHAGPFCMALLERQARLDGRGRRPDGVLPLGRLV